MMVERWYAKAVSSREDGPLVFYGDYIALAAEIAALKAALEKLESYLFGKRDMFGCQIARAALQTKDQPDAK